jgi:hypothetical protein
MLCKALPHQMTMLMCVAAWYCYVSAGSSGQAAAPQPAMDLNSVSALVAPLALAAADECSTRTVQGMRADSFLRNLQQLKRLQEISTQ